MELLQRLSRLLVVTCALFCVATAAFAQPAQTVHRRGFVPASDEVFAVLRQFYDHDAALPLDPRTVERWDTEDGKFEKIVFTTSSGERVPGKRLAGCGKA